MFRFAFICPSFCTLSSRPSVKCACVTLNGKALRAKRTKTAAAFLNTTILCTWSLGYVIYQKCVSKTALNWISWYEKKDKHTTLKLGSLQNNFSKKRAQKLEEILNETFFQRQSVSSTNLTTFYTHSEAIDKRWNFFIMFTFSQQT